MFFLKYNMNLMADCIVSPLIISHLDLTVKHKFKFFPCNSIAFMIDSYI